MKEYFDVHAMADGQATAEQTKAGEAAMDADPKLRSEFETVVMLKDALKTHCKGIHCEDTWSACQGRLAEIEKADRVTGFVSKYAWQLCGSFVMLMLVTGLWTRSLNHNNSLDPSQVTAIAGFSPMAAGAQDEYGFQKFLQSFRITGISRSSIEGRPVYRYEMADGRGDFYLYVSPGVTKLDGACHREVQGLNCYSWIQSGAQFILVADRDHAELEAIAQRISGAR